MRIFWMIGGVWGVVFLLIGAAVAAEPQARVFEMEKISLLGDDSGKPQSTMVSPGGRYLPLRNTPNEEVKKYPQFKSRRPLYGSVTFGEGSTMPAGVEMYGGLPVMGGTRVLAQAPAKSDSGIRFFYALDESGPDEEEKAESAGVLDTLADAVGEPRRIVVTGKYDRLYFDANRDLDLTNDPVVEPMADQSKLGTTSSGVVFEAVSVPVKEADGLGPSPLEVLPRLRQQSSARSFMAFSITTARRGTIELGGEKYTAILTQPASITGRFDGPWTSLILIAGDDSSFPGRVNQQYLSSLMWDAGSFFEFSATPNGDRLTIGPYRGETGVLKVDSGGRQGLEKLGISGTLVAGRTSLRFGDMSYFAIADKLPQHNIPVGDYIPSSLTVDVGVLRVSLSQNYYSLEEPYARLTEPPAGSMTIRADKPFVLGFSGTPVVLFTSPAKDLVFQPGSTIKFGARLIDPKMNMLIRGLSDTTQKTAERTYRISGQSVMVPTYASLAPLVTITDPEGKQVAEGTMPFG